ncbi:MAG: N-acetylglucosamine-6-phosphate deacetylase [Ruminococcaceae bacterium]|nr:N-acetylglucosamine-6-phosphate deacetylase [Oscillospiraceae bacterium]
MKTLIKNARVVLPDCSGYKNADVLIENGKISALGGDFTAERVINASGKYLLPGLIDIHNHGSVGAFFGGDNHEKILDFLAKKGITTVLPTLGVQSIEILEERIEKILELKNKKTNATRIGGIHLEGPFISAEKKGAMVLDSVDCTLQNFNRLIDAGKGEIKLMAIAPERGNALDVIKEGVKRGVRMSLGHTMATYDEAIKAIKAGANHATHTFNAMRSYNHREPGVLGAVLTEASVSCEVICDMVHLHPTTIELIRRTKGIDKMIFISDSVMITGLPDGEYVYDGQIRIVKNGISRTKDGVIAGSCFTMADSAKKLLNFGYSIADIARIGSLNPAQAVGLEKEVGTIEAGKSADILICDNRLNIEQIILGGETIL